MPMTRRCTQCKNCGICPHWKGVKIDLREKADREYPINYCLQMATMVNIGEDIAANCKKFQEFT